MRSAWSRHAVGWVVGESVLVVVDGSFDEPREDRLALLGAVDEAVFESSVGCPVVGAFGLLGVPVGEGEEAEAPPGAVV
jgi:hypothetical protein